MPELPARDPGQPSQWSVFTVRTIICEQGRSWGRVTVTPSGIVLESWPIRKQLLVHTAREVTEVHAWLWAWNGRSYVLHGVGVHCAVYGLPGQGRQLRAAIEAAGFSVREAKSFISPWGPGGRIAAPPVRRSRGGPRSDA
jgi:hypothetical protein